MIRINKQLNLKGNHESLRISTIRTWIETASAKLMDQWSRRDMLPVTWMDKDRSSRGRRDHAISSKMDSSQWERRWTERRMVQMKQEIWYRAKDQVWFIKEHSKTKIQEILWGDIFNILHKWKEIHIYQLNQNHRIKPQNTMLLKN